MGEDSRSSRDVDWGVLEIDGEQGMRDASGRRGNIPYSGAKRAQREVRCCLRGDGDGDEYRADGPHGKMIEQQHLYGILDRLSDLRLEQLSVKSLPKGTEDGAANSPPMTSPDH